MKGHFAGIAFAAVAIGAPACADETPPHIDTSGVNAQPAYPASALPNKERGAVLLGVTVSAEGKVQELDLLESSGYKSLDAAAVAGVMSWHFVPAMKDGSATPGRTDVSIGFQPPDAAAWPQDPPKPKLRYFLATLELKSSARDTRALSRPIPCANGAISSTVELKHDNTGFTDATPSLGISVTNGDDAAVVVQTDQHVYLRLMHGQTVVSEQTFPYRSSRTVQIALMPVSMSWDSTGSVSAHVAANAYQVRLPASPTQVSLNVSGAAALFFNSQLACFPSSPSGN